MARKLEAIIRDRIDIPAIAKAIRAEGYRTKSSKSNKAIVLQGSFLGKLHSKERFEKLADGWIRDNLLGLDWGKSSERSMTWKEAQEYANKEGGRLPEINELQSLVDYGRRNPAIDPIFADTKTDDYYWSGTEVADYAGFAWLVGFYYGYVNGWNEDFNNYVRAVRSCQ